MPIYIVQMQHPTGDGWNTYVLEHIDYLKGLITQGRLLASGPLKGTPLRSGFLIMQAASREEVETMVKLDPFGRQGLICGLTIEQWDPLFGLLTDYSTKQAPSDLATAA